MVVGFDILYLYQSTGALTGFVCFCFYYCTATKNINRSRYDRYTSLRSLLILKLSTSQLKMDTKQMFGIFVKFLFQIVETGRWPQMLQLQECSNCVCHHETCLQCKYFKWKMYLMFLKQLHFHQSQWIIFHAVSIQNSW